MAQEVVAARPHHLVTMFPGPGLGDLPLAKRQSLALEFLEMAHESNLRNGEVIRQFSSKQ